MEHRKTLKGVEAILMQLGSDEARANAITSLVGKRKILTYLLENAIKTYEHNEDYQKAAEIAEKTGLVERAQQLYGKAIDCYEKAELHSYAAELAEKVGLPERAIENYIPIYEYDKAKEVAKKAGILEKAIDIFQKAKLPHAAANIAEGCGLIERAIEILKNDGQRGDAGEIAQRAGMTQEALSLYESSQDCRFLIKAIDLASREGMHERTTQLQYKAIDELIAESRRHIYKGSGKVNERYHEVMDIARDIAKKAGMVEQIIRTYVSEARDTCHTVDPLAHAARIAKKHGMILESERLYSEAIDAERQSLQNLGPRGHGDLADCGRQPSHIRALRDLALEAGMPQRAIEVCEEFGYYGYAAEVAVEKGMAERAVEIYEKNHDFHSAIRAAEKAGMIQRTNALYQNALGWYEKEGRYHYAIALAEKLGMKEKARSLRSLQKLTMEVQ
ncbi:hypothetical protein COU54_03135 [Candidatus Pacearchaeota archaeon CG10_big_fil_rev_8_21_14_0_10_31_24]|nr:MAG: hypothetical protein COU54_03135 [Candidatus Pacearchaeota archaeon CG10_big_fil_rev_8_21_14_0_10_31_24]